MAHEVFCRKYRRSLPGLPTLPYPGPQGQKIYETVSHKAWQEWLRQQTMLINEQHLNLRDPQTREFLQQEMNKFLDNQDHARASGYVPIAKSEEEPARKLD